MRLVQGKVGEVWAIGYELLKMIPPVGEEPEDVIPRPRI